MRKTSILVVPVLTAFLIGCAREDRARDENAATTEQTEQARSDAARQTDGAATSGTARDREAAARRETTRERAATTRREEATQRRAAAPARAEDIRIPAGAVLRVRLDQALDTDENKPGDKFTATLTEPVMVDGKVAIPKGTRFEGAVTTSESSGRLSGRGVLTVKLDSFELDGKRHEITSTTASRITGGRKKRDIGIIGGGAAAGAAIGAVTGGARGAAIGAGAGAAAGTGVAAATGKEDVKLPAETVIVFTLQKPVDIG